MSEYIIRGGADGRARLKLLSTAMGPYTARLLDDARIPQGAHVLDAGCGAGDVTREIARRVGADGRVVGIDMDPVEIGFAREEVGSLGLGNIEFRTGNLLAIETAERFDAVYARFLLSHLSRPQDGLERVMACLKPGGLIILEDVDFRGHFCHPERASFAHYVAWYEAAARRAGVDPQLGPQLPSLLAKAGAWDIEARAVNPAGIAGPIKEMAAATLAAVADRLVAEALATREAVDFAIADLLVAARDPGVFMSMPRIVQCWARAG